MTNDEIKELLERYLKVKELIACVISENRCNLDILKLGAAHQMMADYLNKLADEYSEGE